MDDGRKHSEGGIAEEDDLIETLLSELGDSDSEGEEAEAKDEESGDKESDADANDSYVAARNLRSLRSSAQRTSGVREQLLYARALGL